MFFSFCFFSPCVSVTSLTASLSLPSESLLLLLFNVYIFEFFGNRHYSVCVCFLIFLSLFCSLILFINNNILFMLLLLLFLLQGVVFHTLSICLFLLRDQMVDSYKTFALVLVSVYFRYVQRSFQLFLRSEKFLKPLILLPVLLLFVCVLDWVGLR